MRLVNPATGSVTETTDPHAIVYLRYGRGYWVWDNDEHTASAEPPVEQQQQQQQPEAGYSTGADATWDDDLHA